MLKTSLDGRNFVEKTNPRIILRGRLDSLNAQIILIQCESNNQKFVKHLEEFRQVILKLMRCEVTGENFGELSLWGLSENEIHERSHNPEKYYDSKGHVMPHFEMGTEAAKINFLRTLVREIEIISYEAFNENNFTHVLNRLSSALYILIYEYLPENYDKFLSFRNKDKNRR